MLKTTCSTLLALIAILVCLLLAAQACATECEITDSEFTVLNNSLNSPTSAVLDASGAPVQLNPSSQSYLIDTEYSIADVTTASPGSAVLDASGAPVQSNPASQSYLIDTEFSIADVTTASPGSAVLDASGAPVQSNPASQSYIIDADFIVADVTTASPGNAVLDASGVPVQSDPASRSYLIDAEYSIADVTTAGPGSAVLDASGAPVQTNPSSQSYLIDAEYSIADVTTASPGGEVLDASGAPVQSNPSSQSYLIDAEFIVTDESELEPWGGILIPIIPIAAFTHTITGLTATFTSTSHDPDGYLTAYNWNFGDGTTADTENPTHTYAHSGEYLVKLTVTDNDGYKNSKTETISIGGGAITKVSHPSDIPFGTELTIEVETNIETDITLDLDTFHQTLHGTDVSFNIDTAIPTIDEHSLTVTTESDTYTSSIIIYDPAIYQAITKGLDDLDTCSKDEMREISGITGKTLTNHVYTLLLGVKLEEDVTAGDVLNDLRAKLGDVSDKVTTELETFKNILTVIDPTLSDEVDDMDPVINSITNVQNTIDDVNEQVSDNNIVESINEYVTKPAVYTVFCADEENSIDTRTQTTKSNLDTYYTQDQLDETNEILSIGKEAIANTDGEQIYRLDIGTFFGHEISIKPTLDYLAERQIESLNPPDDLCFLGTCIPGKYNPIWVYHLTVADAESILTLPAYIGWIPATPEDEIIEPTVAPMAVSLIAMKKAIKAYMKYVDVLEKISPWVIDGGMIVSTDLLAKEVDEEHADVIQVISDTLQALGTGGVETPRLTGDGLYVPKGNVLVTTSPDGEIRNFKYVKSDSIFSRPENRRVISLNTGWSQTFGFEQQNISVAITANKSSFNLGETVNLTVSISSDTYIEDAMLWVFVPESNTTMKDIFNVTIGDMSRNYIFSIKNATWHVPRMYLTNFDTILAENYTSFSVGSQSRETGLITLNYDEFYEPGTVNLNVSIHNTGNTMLNSRLEYFGSDPGLTGSIEIPALPAGEHTTEQLAFDLTIPDVYELYFILNASTSSSNGTLDYNTARFTVTARDTLLAFPTTDKPIYSASEGLNIAVTVKNVTLDVVDFPYSLKTITPSGDFTSSTSFIPGYNGTYIVKAKPIAEGYCVIEGETLFIVEKQSSLVVETQTLGNTTTITVKTDLGGVVEGADVVVNGYTLKTDEDGVVEFGSFNMSQLIIRADKFGFNPIVTSVNLTVSNMPDIVIIETWVCWPDNCTICYNVTNIGNEIAPGGHNTTLFVDSVETASDLVAVALEPNERYTGCFAEHNWTYTPPADNITVCADSNDTVAESNETNNCMINTWICSDVDGNGIVNVMDVRLLMMHVADPTGYPVESWAGDVNGDRDIDGDDVQLLLGHVFDPEAHPLKCS